MKLRGSKSKSIVHNLPVPVCTDDDTTPSTSLTVWKKSLLYCCTGFTVIGPNGDLLYRVDNYNDKPNSILLMDQTGHSIATIQYRRDRTFWSAYKGDDIGGSSSEICSVKKQSSSMLNSKANAIALVFVGCGETAAYWVEGSYATRSCKVYDQSRRVVCEIKRKENGNVKFGDEVFQLVVGNGIDGVVAMVIVLILDQMFQ